MSAPVRLLTMIAPRGNSNWAPKKDQDQDKSLEYVPLPQDVVKQLEQR
jgi:hypothetical protein